MATITSKEAVALEEAVETPVEESLQVSTEEASVEEAPVDDTPVEESLQAPTEEEPVEEPAVVEDVVRPSVEVPEEVSVSKLEEFLSNYLREMAPRVPMTDKLGAMNQYGLWKTLESVINSDSNVFRDDFKVVLKYFSDYADSSFGPRYIYRFSEYWEWSTDELDVFQKLINILLLTADPSKRAAGLKQVDLSKALGVGFTDTAKSNIGSFFSN